MDNQNGLDDHDGCLASPEHSPPERGARNLREEQVMIETTTDDRCLSCGKTDPDPECVACQDRRLGPESDHGRVEKTLIIDYCPPDCPKCMHEPRTRRRKPR